ncbi:MAG TPA: CPBP family intramembrane glutamic endopeptidase [Candidatus Acidoferrales bacterium]|nr:CPBP family intramembrane glutamic endopeptidase [Candidatus Acidoferrales bacterium]
MKRTLIWWLALLDVTGLPLMTFWVIWRDPPPLSRMWMIIPVWLAASFLIHRDTPKTLGWRGDNFLPTLRRATFILGPMALALIVAGLAMGMRAPSLESVAPKHYWNYFAFCLLQQVGLNSLLTNRLLTLVERRAIAVFLAALIFAAFHWPNPVLVPATFVAGLAMSWLFARERNILPITLWHVVLGMTLNWAFPIAWHHAMRVGPGYYTFHLPGS